MKKMIAMILMLVTILSLCACGAKEPAQPAEEGGQVQQETTMPEEPKVPNLEMFQGKWMIVEADFLDEITALDIHEDGTMEVNGEILTWTAQKAHPNSGYEMILNVEYPADPNFPNSEAMWAFDFYLKRTAENTYVAEMRESQYATSGDQFYREGDYEVIALTDENAMEYLEQLPAESTFEAKDSFGSSKEYRAIRKEVIKLKDGLGALSNFSGKLIFEKTYVEIYLNDDATGVVEGNDVNTYVDEQGVWDKIDTEYAREYTYTVYWCGAPGDSSLEKHGAMECNRLIGTKDVSGNVFIPV